MTNKEISSEKSYYELEGNILSYHSMRECIRSADDEIQFYEYF